MANRIEANPVSALLLSQVPFLVLVVGLVIRYARLRLAQEKDRRESRQEVIADLSESRAALKDLLTTSREQQRLEVASLQAQIEAAQTTAERERLISQKRLTTMSLNAGDSRVVALMTVLVCQMSASTLRALHHKAFTWDQAAGLLMKLDNATKLASEMVDRLYGQARLVEPPEEKRLLALVDSIIASMRELMRLLPEDHRRDGLREIIEAGEAITDNMRKALSD